MLLAILFSGVALMCAGENVAETTRFQRKWVSGRHGLAIDINPVGIYAAIGWRGKYAPNEHRVGPVLGIGVYYRGTWLPSSTLPDRWIWFGLPWWFMIALLIGPALDRLGAARGRRLLAWPHGSICRNCGYDLRATPARCPECGRKSWE